MIFRWRIRRRRSECHRRCASLSIRIIIIIDGRSGDDGLVLIDGWTTPTTPPPPPPAPSVPLPAPVRRLWRPSRATRWSFFSFFAVGLSCDCSYLVWLGNWRRPSSDLWCRELKNRCLLANPSLSGSKYKTITHSIYISLLLSPLQVIVILKSIEFPWICLYLV